MPKRSETSLGNMDGLKSYEPDKGWSDIPNSELNVNENKEKIHGDANLDNWEIKDKDHNLNISKSTTSE